MSMCLPVLCWIMTPPLVVFTNIIKRYGFYCYIFLITVFYVCVCVRACAQVWRLEDSIGECVLCFHVWVLDVQLRLLGLVQGP